MSSPVHRIGQQTFDRTHRPEDADRLMNAFSVFYSGRSLTVGPRWVNDRSAPRTVKSEIEIGRPLTLQERRSPCNEGVTAGDPAGGPDALSRARVSDCRCRHAEHARRRQLDGDEPCARRAGLARGNGQPGHRLGERDRPGPREGNAICSDMGWCQTFRLVGPDARALRTSHERRTASARWSDMASRKATP